MNGYELYKKEIEEESKVEMKPVETQDCPHCGRCPVCGRPNNHYYHRFPPYNPYPCHPYYRYWDGTSWEKQNTDDVTVVYGS